jgi:hypothetical protein
MYDANMVEMILKVRALIEDFVQSSFEVFTYSTSPIFTLAEPNIQDVTKTLVNSNSLGSGEASTFDATTNKCTITGVTFSSGDIVEFDYTFTKYNDSEILQYIRAACVWLSINDNSNETYKVRTNDGIIVPSPTPKDLDLICIIASILIKPNYIHYRMPNLAVNYPNKMTQEEKIRSIISQYKRGVGIITIVQWNRSPGL